MENFGIETLKKLRRTLEIRKERHKKSKFCSFPDTCGACHYYSGYIDAFTDIIENNLPKIETKNETGI